MSTIIYPHVEFTPEGIPLISGTRTKVIEIVLDRLSHNWDADEIQRQHPHLTLAQIHAALTYYYDHQSEFDAVIQSQLVEVEQITESIDDSKRRANCQSHPDHQSDDAADRGSFPDRIRLPADCTRPVQWETAETEPEWDPVKYKARLLVEIFYGSEDADTAKS